MANKMRTKTETMSSAFGWNDATGGGHTAELSNQQMLINNQHIILETLCDIRDLLARADEARRGLR